MVHTMDENIGKLIESLKNHNLFENSLIIFSSSNGGLTTQRSGPLHQLFHWAEGYLCSGIKNSSAYKSTLSKIFKKINDVTVSHGLFP